jgi:KaiC/GvpD/RAD55 family RecA-like ATPase
VHTEREHEGSTFLRHEPCPECGSSDANGVYDDGHTFCFACSHHTPSNGGDVSGGRRKVSAGFVEPEEYPGIPSRGITAETCEKFGYARGTYAGVPVHVAPYYNADGKLVAQKIRKPHKKFAVVGDLKQALPFGAHVWQKSGRKIVVTEGEIDALAMSQAQGNKWPVVSIGCGAGGQIKKYMAQQRDYFLGFEEVVLMFDNDEPGRKAARVAAEVIGPTARIAELPLKDAADMLKEGRVAELISAMWNARPHRPDGIVEMSTLREEVLAAVEWGKPWPWDALTAATYGRRYGEVYCLGAGTGIGKTDLFTQIVEQTVRELNEPVGLFFMEQHPRETALRVAGKFAKKPFHVPDGGWTQSELEETWDNITKTKKVFLYDSFGNNDWETVENRIRYLAHAEGVRHFFIDHLTALAAWKDDERKALEEIMSAIGGLVKELDVCVYLISHLATPDGTPHEEGGRVMIRHLKGSRAIGFWCHFIFGMERDQQDEDEDVRHLTTFRILKDRYTGKSTGLTFHLQYNSETGMLEEVDYKPKTNAEQHGFDTETSTGPDEGSSDF